MGKKFLFLIIGLSGLVILFNNGCINNIKKESTLLAGEWKAIDKRGIVNYLYFFNNGHYRYEYHSISVSGRVGKYMVEKRGLISLNSDTLFINDNLNIYNHKYAFLYEILDEDKLKLISVDKFLLKKGDKNKLINSTFENEGTQLRFTKDTLYEYDKTKNVYLNSPISDITTMTFYYKGPDRYTSSGKRYYKIMNNELYLADSEEWLTFTRVKSFKKPELKNNNIEVPYQPQGLNITEANWKWNQINNTSFKSFEVSLENSTKEAFKYVRFRLTLYTIENGLKKKVFSKSYVYSEILNSGDMVRYSIPDLTEFYIGVDVSNSTNWEYSAEIEDSKPSI